MPDSFDKTASSGEQFAFASAGDRAWRQEVSSRLDRYRVRRKRAAHESSMSLDFDGIPPQTPEPDSRPEKTRGRERHVPAALRNLPPDPVLAVEEAEESGQVACEQAEDQVRSGDSVASNREEREDNVLQFPRSAFSPVFCEELAEPVQLKPRILDVPEQFELPAAPIVDIGLAPLHRAEAEGSEFELPLVVASIGRRAAAGMIDLAIVLSGVAMFLGLLGRWGVQVEGSTLGIGITAAMTALFWAGFQYLFLAHGGGTPGAHVARLELTGFDGEPVSRNREMRALGMVFSYFPLGLGVAWALFDEDGLGWHDRMSHTYLRVAAGEAEVGENDRYASRSD